MGDLFDEDAPMTCEEPEEIVYLFTTKTCPNCKRVKASLGGLRYIEIDAEDNPELAMKYNIRQAPTLLVVNRDKVHKYANLSNILKFVEENALAKV